jgi:hypothetical protein
MSIAVSKSFLREPKDASPITNSSKNNQHLKDVQLPPGFGATPVSPQAA